MRVSSQIIERKFLDNFHKNSIPNSVRLVFGHIYSVLPKESQISVSIEIFSMDFAPLCTARPAAF